MKSSRVFWGSFFITIGVLYFLEKWGFWGIDWSIVWDLWPLIFIFWGLTVIARDWSFRPVISGLFGIFIGFQVFGTVGNFAGFWEWRDEYDDHYSYYDYSEEYDSDITSAEVVLNGGVGEFTIRGNTHELFQAKARGKRANYDVTTTTDGDHAIVEIDQNRKRFTLTEGGTKNKLELKLNPAPSWDLDLSIDAAKAEFDLRNLSVNRLFLQSGAADITARFGLNQQNSKVTVKLGAASLRLYIPEEAGVRLRGEMSLISKDFEGLEEIADDLYESDNYKSADNVFDLEISGGISSLKLIRN